MNKRQAQLSLYHLHFIVEEIANIIYSLTVSEKALPEIQINPIKKYITIRSCAFYDELINQTLKHFKSDEPRYQVLMTAKDYVITKRDEYFPDLRNIRNNVLAHNFRSTKQNKYQSIFEIGAKYKFPKSAAALSVNIALMDSMLSAIKLLYPDIHRIMNDGIKPPIEENSPIKDNCCSSIINSITNDIQRIVDKAEAYNGG